MAHITNAQLIAKAIELNAALTEETAKLLIKNYGAKSYKKVAEAVEAAKLAEEKALKKVARKEKGEVKLVEPGPRGFRFGQTYVQSVIDASKIAMKEANKLKLVQFAEAMGLEGITMKSDIAEAVKSMKVAAKKYFKDNFAAEEVAA